VAAPHDADRAYHVAVVFNPNSGRHPARQREDAIRAALGRAGARISWFETAADDAGAAAAARAAGSHPDVVIASGGDGTVMACATALADTDVPLAVLPAGTGNLVARNLGVPNDLQRAVALALGGPRRRIDVGVHDGQRFLIMAGLGFDAVMLAGARPSLKQRYGWLAYVLSASKALKYPQDWFTIELDGAPAIRRRASCVLIANLGRVQGDVPVVPGARADDGRLDVAVIRARTLGDWIQVASRLLFGGRWGQVRVEIFRARHVDVRGTVRHPVEHDGDVGPPLDRLVVEIAPAALTMCLPDSNVGTRAHPGGS
jgi:YegS/Rv2252/BmrU family lipid kinase